MRTHMQQKTHDTKIESNLSAIKTALKMSKNALKQIYPVKTTTRHIYHNT